MTVKSIGFGCESKGQLHLNGGADEKRPGTRVSLIDIRICAKNYAGRDILEGFGERGAAFYAYRDPLLRWERGGEQAGNKESASGTRQEHAC